MTSWLLRASTRLYGEPPGKDAPRSTRLRWMRRMDLRNVPFLLLTYVFFFLLAPPSWLTIVVAICGLLWLANVIAVSVRIRRAQRREQAPGSAP
jgi:hypothetical protein